MIQRGKYQQICAESEGTNTLFDLRGYWIHIGTDYMGLDQAATPYDWERHKMYGLGDDKYECTWRGLWREGFVLETL